MICQNYDLKKRVETMNDRKKFINQPYAILTKKKSSFRRKKTSNIHHSVYQNCRLNEVTIYYINYTN